MTFYELCAFLMAFQEVFCLSWPVGSRASSKSHPSLSHANDFFGGLNGNYRVHLAERVQSGLGRISLAVDPPFTRLSTKLQSISGARHCKAR